MFRRFASAMACAIAVSFCPGARADTVNATFENVHSASDPQNSTYANGLLISASLNGTNLGEGWIGQYNWTQNSGTSLAAGGELTQANSSFFTYCIEITQDISPGGTYDYTLLDPQFAPKPGTNYTGLNGMGQSKATLLAALWAEQIGLNAGVSNLTSIDDQAAFQIAVWDIEYGSGLSVNVESSGHPTVLSKANDMVAALATYQGPLANLVALSSDDLANQPGAQDQITAIPAVLPPVSSAPLPPAVTAGLALLAGVGVVRRIRSAAGPSAIA